MSKSFPTTLQALFDQAVPHLLKMKKRALCLTDATCVYRYNDNPNARTRCAIGAVIPNDAYTPSMEGKSAGGLIEQFSTNLGLDALDLAEREKLGRVANFLQGIHDCEYAFEQRPTRIRTLAEEHGLTISKEIEAALISFE